MNYDVQWTVIVTYDTHWVGQIWYYASNWGRMSSFVAMFIPN